MVINPNIDTFITKFGWTERAEGGGNASTYISLMSMVNPLGGLIGTFIAKFIVRIYILRMVID